MGKLISGIVRRSEAKKVFFVGVTRYTHRQWKFVFTARYGYLDTMRYFYAGLGWRATIIQQGDAASSCEYR